MPAIRGTYLKHPQTGEVGLWLELVTSPPGTLTGMARTDWPTTRNKTLAQYQAELNALYQGLCERASDSRPYRTGSPVPDGWKVSADGNSLIPLVVKIQITLSRISPAVLIEDVTVSDGACREVRVAR